MAKHVWSVLCYKGCLDQYTNQVSLLDVIEGIIIKPMEPVPEIPMGKEIHLHRQVYFFAHWDFWHRLHRLNDDPFNDVEQAHLVGVLIEATLVAEHGPDVLSHSPPFDSPRVSGSVHCRSPQESLT